MSKQTYTLILASILLQSASILKDIYSRYMNTQYKQSNPTLTKYEIDLIAFKFLDFHHKTFLKDKTPPQAKPHRLKERVSANA
ncbi:hypothetical protein VN0759_08690 [Helicobacter pylori]|nr:hypothetical protein VN0759_08690 [Helicobacter pylori]